MEHKDENKGICGVVADLIKVDAKYETAIETALGGNIQNIVTEDEETAKKMIRFLKEKKALHAQFVAERQAEYAKDQERGKAYV